MESMHELSVSQIDISSAKTVEIVHGLRSYLNGTTTQSPKDITKKINQTYPYKIRVWIGDGIDPTVVQYSTIKDMVEDACGIGYISGLNDTGYAVEFIEGDVIYADTDGE